MSALMTVTDATKAIASIDKRINTARRDRRSWCHSAECQLFRDRGEAQLVLANLRIEQALHKARSYQPRKCPTCKGSGKLSPTPA